MGSRSSFFVAFQFWITLLPPSLSSLQAPHPRYLEMNGLRTLARKEKTDFNFPPDRRYNNATTIEILPDLLGPGVNHWRSQYADDLLLAKFLERGGWAFGTPGNEDEGENRTPHFGVKLIMVATKAKTYIFMNESIFQELILTLNPDPLFNRMFHVRYYQFFEFLGSIANGGIVTMRLRACNIRFLLSIRQHEEGTAFDSRCVALRATQDAGPPQLVEVKHLFDCLEDLKEDAHSPLFLPFALSVYAVHDCRDSLTTIQRCVHLAALTTSHGRFDRTYGLDNGTPIDRQRVVKQSESIGLALTHAAFVSCTLDSLKSLWTFLEAMAEDIPSSARTEQVVQSTKNILEAIQFLREEVKGLRQALRDGELRIRNQASLVRFPYILVFTRLQTAFL